ncbi:hypothetical protein [Mucilaginibacter sp.]
MRPVNNNDIYRAYRKFLLFFLFLVVLSIGAVYFFFLTSNREVALLNAKAREADRLVALRSDIYNDFDQIMLRMQQLSEYTKMNSEEINNQTLLLNDIQVANQHIQDRLQQDPMPLKSFDLYRKLSNNVGTAAAIKDSLFTTRFQIESARSQLESCNKTNKNAISRLKGRYR